MEPDPRIIVDRDRCVGAGNCVLTAPEVFDQSDDDGLVVLLGDTFGDNQRPAVQEAVGLCPGGAIRVR